jgi:hypothetical protein
MQWTNLQAQLSGLYQKPFKKINKQGSHMSQMTVVFNSFLVFLENLPVHTKHQPYHQVLSSTAPML